MADRLPRTPEELNYEAARLCADMEQLVRELGGRNVVRPAIAAELQQRAAALAAKASSS